MLGLAAMELLRSHQTSYATDWNTTSSPVCGRWHGMAVLGCAMGIMVTLALLVVMGPSSALWALSRSSMHVTAPKVAHFEAPNARIVKEMGGLTPSLSPSSAARHLKSATIATKKATYANFHPLPEPSLRPLRPAPIRAKKASHSNPKFKSIAGPVLIKPTIRFSMWKWGLAEPNVGDKFMTIDSAPSALPPYSISLGVLSILFPVGIWLGRLFRNSDVECGIRYEDKAPSNFAMLAVERKSLEEYEPSHHGINIHGQGGYIGHVENIFESSSSGQIFPSSALAGRKTGAAPIPTHAPPPKGVWPGLSEWRSSPLNRRWLWGKRDAVDVNASKQDIPMPDMDIPWAMDTLPNLPALPDTLAECADLVLRTPDPATKAALSHGAFAKFVHGEGAMPIGVAVPPSVPARPNRPELVPVWEVPSPKKCDLGVSAAMIHNVAHIELNAIDLAWDTVARFSSLASQGSSEAGLPLEFFLDFAHIADDEARHLGWCLQRLREMGVSYGDIPAHNMLWEGAEQTTESLPARLAVVPCMQEARGLDAGPRLFAKLQGHGDNRSAAVIQRISEEEIAHVAVGVLWFRYLCSALDVDPGDAFRAHIAIHAPESLRGPFNHDQRVAAGLEPDWYSIGPEHQVGHDFEHGLLGAGDARALVSRLGQILVLEGVDGRELNCDS